MSAINVSHNKFANKLAVHEGLLLFAENAQELQFRQESRIGRSISRSAVENVLKIFGQEDSAGRVVWGRDPTRGFILRTDNCQTFSKERVPGVGRESQVMMGMSCIVNEPNTYNREIMTVARKREIVAKNRRQELTVDGLLGMIDTPHIHTVCELHWMACFVRIIPQLKDLRSAVHNLFRAEGRADKISVPAQKTKVEPLKTCAKDEKLIVELKDALLDFMEQMGVTKETFDGRQIYVGGDGLTFEMMLRLKDYSQFLDDDFDRLDFLEPFLETWHTAWTNDSRIHENFWGAVDEDYSTLGHSASKIGVQKPSKLDKVDYYKGRYLLNLVLDARMMDCWRYVNLPLRGRLMVQTYIE